MKTRLITCYNILLAPLSAQSIIPGMYTRRRHVVDHLPCDEGRELRIVCVTLLCGVQSMFFSSVNIFHVKYDIFACHRVATATNQITNSPHSIGIPSLPSMDPQHIKPTNRNPFTSLPALIHIIPRSNLYFSRSASSVGLSLTAQGQQQGVRARWARHSPH